MATYLLHSAPMLPQSLSPALEVRSRISKRASSRRHASFATLIFLTLTPSCNIALQAETAPSPTGAQLISGSIVRPTDFMESVKDFGAVGDGTTDDTVAIQRALAEGRGSPSADYFGLPKALYFPPGIYLVRDTLDWNGCCVTLQGAGPAVSVIRLAPSSYGFSDSSNPKPVIQTPNPAGNESFRQNVFDLGISVGAANPGAIALSYISNNVGAVHDVQITSEDGNAKTGMDLTRNWPGPLLLKNISIKGFQVGIDLGTALYGPTLENITLQSQHLYGIRNINQTVSILNLKSTNGVPAVFNQNGFVSLISAALDGGASANVAIVTNSTFYLREISSSGYGSTLEDTSQSTVHSVAGSISEYLVGTPMSIAGTPQAKSLDLKILETPTYVDQDLTHWAAFEPAWYGNTSALQSVFNSGASTIYFPFKAYLSPNQTTITVPDTVHHIAGFSSIINGVATGTDGGGVLLVVNSNSSSPLFIDEFGYGIKIQHTGKRPVVVRDSIIAYSSNPEAGSLYLEDVVDSQPLTVQPGQQVYARQLNIEGQTTGISNQGGTLWILGLKTEGAATVINTVQNGRTELLGTIIYPARAVPSSTVGFSSTDSKVSYMYSQPDYCTSCGYSIQVQETISGKTGRITSSSSKNFRMPLFVGY
jgi:Pectate lyase superfamily protein